MQQTKKNKSYWIETIKDAVSKLEEPTASNVAVFVGLSVKALSAKLSYYRLTLEDVGIQRKYEGFDRNREKLIFLLKEKLKKLAYEPTTRELAKLTGFTYGNLKRKINRYKISRKELGISWGYYREYHNRRSPTEKEYPIWLRDREHELKNNPNFKKFYDAIPKRLLFYCVVDGHHFVPLSYCSYTNGIRHRREFEIPDKKTLTPLEILIEKESRCVQTDMI